MGFIDSSLVFTLINKKVSTHWSSNDPLIWKLLSFHSVLSLFSPSKDSDTRLSTTRRFSMARSTTTRSSPNFSVSFSQLMLKHPKTLLLWFYFKYIFILRWSLFIFKRSNGFGNDFHSNSSSSLFSLGLLWFLWISLQLCFFPLKHGILHCYLQLSLL